jgi:hypothetical protein
VISTASMSRSFRIKIRIKINHLLRYYLCNHSNRIITIESRTSAFVKKDIHKKSTLILLLKHETQNEDQIRKNETKFVRKWNYLARNFIKLSNAYAIRTSWKSYSFSTSLLVLSINDERIEKIENNQEITNHLEKTNKANKIKKLINQSNC